jgi:hypothetical protein
VNLAAQLRPFPTSVIEPLIRLAMREPGTDTIRRR